MSFSSVLTVHRGMWHSLPAAAIAGLAAYLVMPCESDGIRAYKALGVVVGFLVHLILDEIWAVEVGVGRLRTKKSFGTALKFLGSNPTANVVVYGLLFALCYTAWSDNQIAARLRDRARYDLSEPEGRGFFWPIAPASQSSPSQPAPWQQPIYPPPSFGFSASAEAPERR